MMASESIKNSKGKSSDNLKERPKMQAELQQKYLHLQTILILAQFNSTYYQLNLTLNKAFSKLQKKYYLHKVMAFQRIKNKVQPIYFSLRQAKFYYLASKFSREGEISNQLISNNLNKTNKRSEEYSIRLFSVQQARIKYSHKIEKILENICKLIQKKHSNFIYFSYLKIVKYSNESSILKFLSEKSTKIEATENQKSKILRRSVEKQSNRKSFSMQKSNKQKHQYYIPVKYQPSNQIPLNISRQSDCENKQSGGSSTISIKYYNSQQNSVRSRRNFLDCNRERRGVKCSSNTKYNTSANFGGDRKIEKTVELDLLHKKYKKLISQFNSFSEKFLKVIQQEEV